MRKLFLKISRTITTLAIFATIINANSTCIYILHQDEIPEIAKRKYSKF